MIVTLERCNRLIGQLVAWLTVLMVLITTAIVVQRYWFETGSIRMQESVTYMHAAVLLLAAAYTLTLDGHVRVDVVYTKLSNHAQAWVNLIGTLVLLLPVCIFLIWYSWEYVVTAWQIRESSQEAGGLPFPFPAIMKSFIPITGVLLFMQGIVMVARALVYLRTPSSPDSDKTA